MDALITTLIEHPTHTWAAAFLFLIAVVGRRVMRGMDRVAVSVESLNEKMATVLERSEGHEKRIALLENK